MMSFSFSHVAAYALKMAVNRDNTTSDGALSNSSSDSINSDNTDTTSTSTTLTILDRLRFPKAAEIARKRKLKVNPPPPQERSVVEVREVMIPD